MEFAKAGVYSTKRYGSRVPSPVSPASGEDVAMITSRDQPASMFERMCSASDTARSIRDFQAL